MSEDQNQHSEEGSFKEQIMRALEEGRKNREADATKKTHTRPESSKVKKDANDDDDLASSYERLFGNRRDKKDTTASEQKSESSKKEIKKEEPPKEPKTEAVPKKRFPIVILFQSLKNEKKTNELRLRKRKLLKKKRDLLKFRIKNQPRILTIQENL